MRSGRLKKYENITPLLGRELPSAFGQEKRIIKCASQPAPARSVNAERERERERGEWRAAVCTYRRIEARGQQAGKQQASKAGRP
jgi:hypothetical protein